MVFWSISCFQYLILISSIVYICNHNQLLCTRPTLSFVSISDYSSCFFKRFVSGCNAMKANVTFNSKYSYNIIWYTSSASKACNNIVNTLEQYRCLHFFCRLFACLWVSSSSIGWCIITIHHSSPFVSNCQNHRHIVCRSPHMVHKVVIQMFLFHNLDIRIVRQDVYGNNMK